MSTDNKIQVIKIPNPEKNSLQDSSQPITRMPRMFLELLENKEKVKPHLQNREYDPNEVQSVLSFDDYKEDNKVQDRFDTISEKSSENEDNESASSISISVSNSSKNSSQKNDDFNNEFENEDNDNDDTNSTYSNVSSVRNETKEKLKQILQDDDYTNVPRLSDLERDGKIQNTKVIPNMGQIDQITAEEEEDLKRELLFKFELLKKSYKNIEVPEFSIHSNVKQMNESYENLLRHVSLDSSVENYKNILIGGFMLFEFILGTWLKFDMSGFTQQQILNMTQYERLLIELGEKSYVPEGKQWPVEIRLLGLVVMNAVIFIISKMILKNTGSDLMGMMNHVKQQPLVNPNVPKKKMKGPSIDIDF